MKKIIYIFTILALVLTSCDKNESLSQTKEDSFNVLYNSINTLNYNFSTKNSLNSLSQNDIQKIPFWKRLKLIAVCDLSGAIIGGTLAGGGGALGGAILFSLGAVLGPSEYVVANSSSIPTIEFEDNNLGEMHNIIINEIIEENPTLLNSDFDATLLIELVTAKMIEHNIDISANNNFNQIFNVESKTMTDNILKSESISEAMDVIVNSRPELRLETVAIERYLNMAVQIRDQETRLDYTQEFMNVVDKSNIPVSSKQQINSGLAVFENSSVLWEQ